MEADDSLVWTTENDVRRQCGDVLIHNRGVVYKLPLKSIHRHPESRLAQDCNKALVNPAEDPIHLYYYRNSHIFEAIIDFYQDGHLHFPKHVCWQAFEEELVFAGLSPSLLDHCCKPIYLKARAVRRATEVIRHDWEAHMGIQIRDLACITHSKIPASKRFWLFIEDPDSSLSAKLWSLVSTFLLVASMVVIIIQSMPQMRGSVPVLSINSTNVTDLHQDISPYTYCVYVDLILCCMLMVEYVARFSCCPNKIRFVKDLKANLAMLSLLPSIVGGIYINRYMSGGGVPKAIDIFLRLRILRVMALLRYDHYYPSLRILTLTLRDSAKSVAFILMLVMTLAFFYGGCLYFFEMGLVHSIPYGMWWASVTMTTLGYGDVYPTTPMGYAIAVLCVLSGIVVLVLPIPVISTNFQLYSAAMHEFQITKQEARSNKMNINPKLECKSV